MAIIDFDLTAFVESTKTRIGLSLTFIFAGILLLLSNLGIDIKYAHISINDILPHNYIGFVQFYIIVNLFSLAYTMLKKELFTNPKMVINNTPQTLCHKCNNSMDVSERTCAECGSIFTYKNKKSQN